MSKESADWSTNLDYFRNYDFFQSNTDNYNRMIDLHLGELEDSEKILDFGAGTGNLVLELLKEGKKILAADPNSVALEILREKCRGFDNLSVLNLNETVDINYSQIPREEFDAVNSSLVLPFPINIAHYLVVAYRSLRKGGRFVLTSWACREDIFEGIIMANEREYMSKGLFPEFEKEWNIQKAPTQNMANNIVSKNLTKDNLERMLRYTGFKSTGEIESPYGDFTYSFVCQK